jgi:hypothetical protein
MDPVRDLAGRLARSRLTEMRSVSPLGASDRLYWRNWRVPSGNAIVQLMYWPGLKLGAGAPSCARSVIDVTSTLSWTRASMRIARVTPAATPEAAYSVFSASMNCLASAL